MNVQDEFSNNCSNNNKNITNTINENVNTNNNENRINTINENVNIHVQVQIYYSVLINVFITLNMFQMNALNVYTFLFKIIISEEFGFDVIYTVSPKNFDFCFNENYFCQIFNHYSISSINELDFNSFTFEIIFCNEYILTVIYTIFPFNLK